MSLDSEHCETCPVSIDISSVLPVNIEDFPQQKQIVPDNEDSIEHPSCPTVLVLSSRGILLAFIALSSRAEHQNINIQPESLRSVIYGKVSKKVDVKQSEYSCIGSPDIPIPSDSLGSAISSESTCIPKQNELQRQAKVCFYQKRKTEVTTSFNTSFIFADFERGIISDKLVTVCKSSSATKLHQSLPCTNVKRFTAADRRTFATPARTDLIRQLREDFREKLLIFGEQFFELCEQNDWLQNLQKNSAKQLGLNTVGENTSSMALWLDALENQVKESICSVEEQLGIANNVDRELFDNKWVWDFNNMHRSDKLVETLTKLGQKIVNVEDIAVTAKNICKRMVSRRKILPLKKDGVNKFFTSTKSLSNSLFNYKTYCGELAARTAIVTVEQQRELLNVINIGTQSSDYLLSKETKSSTHMITFIPTTSAGYMSDGTNKSLASNQFQKLTESAVNLSITSSSFSSTTIPTTSSCFSTEAVIKRLPIGESFTKIPETVTLDEEQPGHVTFSFKNLDTPSTATYDVSSRGTAFCTVNTANIFDYNPTVAQKIFSMKSKENETTSVGPVTTSESLTNIFATIASSSTTATATDRTSTKNSEISNTNNETTVANSSALRTTSKISDSKTNISFTFKLPTAENQQTASAVNGSVNGGNTSTTVELQPKDLDIDLESAASSVNTTQNIFGSGLKFLSSAQPQIASAFRNASSVNKGSSVFDANGPATSGGGGLFSRMQQSNAASSTSFSFATSTTFGGAPSFDSKPVFGSPSLVVSAFGQQRPQHVISATTAFSKLVFAV
uniref:Uncharacterized protein n=1 Tax=Wuchereria bancrofti TaxID=6293 RepID=A0A1I8EUB2_WUCBA